ncbi:Anthranilate synthase component 1 [Candidatus Calditenuaceae archaeon HR02]|nr:Anthranilate synthase component 1 [Candidatus Calditenuaceae archaeon HR02]
MLESVSGPRKLAEFSFIGWDPVATLAVEQGVLEVVDRVEGARFKVDVGNPLRLLGEIILSSRNRENRFRFLGGGVGYISFESVKYWEDIRFRVKEEHDFPEMEFGVYNRGIIFDHRMNEVYIYGHDPGSDWEEVKRLMKDVGDEEPLRALRAKSSISKEKFEEMVVRAKEYIAAGDVLQVVPSRRIDVEVAGSYRGYYRELRRLNPSPYMYVLRLDDRWIVGTSPEMLVRVEGSRVETFPIAGTRPMTGRAEEDDRLMEELRRDEKELAEHVMLVDLARNDLGRVCRYGTVRVASLMEVHRYSHVQHLVSHVVGELKLGLSAIDALEATFPAGTVTGAPKLRAIEIIDELEPVRRGPYAGCVGYLSFNGSADFAITIRTLLGHSDSSASIQVGMGVVADSKPEAEWYETEHKAAALLSAMAR